MSLKTIFDLVLVSLIVILPVMHFISARLEYRDLKKPPKHPSTRHSEKLYRKRKIREDLHDMISAILRIGPG